MNFGEILRRVEPILLGNEFELKTNEDHYVRYESEISAITIADDYRERCIYVYVGRKDQALHELDADTLKTIFQFTTSHDQYFPNILDQFLTREGSGILRNDPNLLRELSVYKQKQAREYTERLNQDQIRKSLESSWRAKDYAAFITAVAKLDEKDLTEIEKKRKRVAESKL